ncbi:hypothetical protein AOLI_G00144020 [Acnodon oligacanthus]
MISAHFPKPGPGVAAGSARWQGAGGGPWEPRRAPVHAGKGRTGRAAADAGRVGGQERGTGVKGAQGERGGSGDKM